MTSGFQPIRADNLCAGNTLLHMQTDEYSELYGTRYIVCDNKWYQKQIRDYHMAFGYRPIYQPEPIMDEAS